MVDLEEVRRQCWTLAEFATTRLEQGYTDFIQYHGLLFLANLIRDLADEVEQLQRKLKASRTRAMHAFNHGVSHGMGFYDD